MPEPNPAKLLLTHDTMLPSGSAVDSTMVSLGFHAADFDQGHLTSPAIRQRMQEDSRHLARACQSTCRDRARPNAVRAGQDAHAWAARDNAP
jgi:hypothetical protein